jgi:hypothetical protein
MKNKKINFTTKKKYEQTKNLPGNHGGQLIENL